MITRVFTALTLAATLMALPLAARAEDFPGVDDTSFTAANGDRTMRLAATIPATPEQVWAALSTAEGWKRWAVKTAFVEFREGGQIETSYKPDMPKGDRDNIRNQIIALVPNRLLVFRNVQAPTNFKDPELFARVTTVIALEPVAGGTRVTISGEGYGAGPAFDALYGMFRWGNSYTLVELRKSFEPKP